MKDLPITRLELVESLYDNNFDKFFIEYNGYFSNKIIQAYIVGQICVNPPLSPVVIAGFRCSVPHRGFQGKVPGLHGALHLATRVHQRPHAEKAGQGLQIRRNPSRGVERSDTQVWFQEELLENVSVRTQAADGDTTRSGSTTT